MEQTKSPWSGLIFAIAFLAGLLAFVLLFPASGVDTLPPQCYSVLGSSVPCGPGVALLAGAAIAGLVILLTWLKARRR